MVHELKKKAEIPEPQFEEEEEIAREVEDELKTKAKSEPCGDDGEIGNGDESDEETD